jgi:hypothetical protein
MTAIRNEASKGMTTNIPMIVAIIANRLTGYRPDLLASPKSSQELLATER